MAERVTFADLLKKTEEKKLFETSPPSLVSNTTTRNTTSQATPPTLLTTPTPPTLLTKAAPPTLDRKDPAAPEKDFQKVANSIVREALPQGLFIGKSKQLYDYLYLMTRGAIQSKRSIRITKAVLMRGSSIGSERTLLKNLGHLKAVGLIKITEFDGQHGGNEYETFLPEERQPTAPTARHPHQAPYPLQKVGTLPTVESVVSGVGLVTDNKQDTVTLRLNTKTDTTDDEAFAAFIRTMQTAAEEVTGRKLRRQDGENLENLAELLVLELKIAARRTGAISSVPAFLTEVLRRQFFSARRTEQQGSSSTKTTKTKTDVVGKAEAETFEIKPLDEQGRETALAEL
ncbi:MAG: hypothetical protein ACR2L1_02865, partial [Pyrinomonadaceae bacterium]